MLIALVTAAALAGAAPSAGELQRLLTRAGGHAVQVQGVRCQILGDPTEHKCIWRQKAGSGTWETWSAILARDGGRWVLIDTPGRTSRP